MPPISEIRTTFTIDLNPFSAGLKTMLAMTQAAGKQILPVLNLQAKPDFTVFDEQLKGLTKTVDDYIGAQVESIKTATTQTGATGDLGGKVDDLEKKTRKAGIAVDSHSMSLRHMKRESLEVFGGVSFLVQSIIQLANSSGLGDEKLQKMSQSMAQGVSAGFGLASMLSLLGLATGGTAAIIGALVTVGVTLLNFFSSAETRAKIAAGAVESFTQSLRAATTKDLQDYRQALLSNISAIDKNIASLEKMRATAALEQGGIYGIVEGIDALVGTSITAYGTIDKLLDEQRAKRKLSLDELKKLDEQQEANQMNAVETRKRTLELQIETEQNTFQQRRLMAEKDYRDEVERIIASNAANKQKEEAIKAVGIAHNNAIKKIDDDERQEADQHAMRLMEIEDRREMAFIDVQEKLELATAQTELSRLAIQERYATERLNVEEVAARQSIELEIQRLEAIGGPEAERKIERLNSVLTELDLEYGEKRANIRAATNEKLAQLDVQNETAIRDLRKQALLAELDAAEKSQLAQETNEEKKTEISRQYALMRLQLERDAALYLTRLEMDQIYAIEGPLTEAQQRRLEQLKTYILEYTKLLGAKEQSVNIEANVKILPVGSIAAQLQKVQDLQNAFNRETDAGVRQRIDTELRLEQQKLDKMTLFGDELVVRERQDQEQRRQAWRETHQFEMSLINGMTAGVRSMFDQFLSVHRQAKDQWDAIWLSMENTAIQALSELAVKTLENWIIDQVLMAGSVAATNAAMAAIIPGAATAATLVSIASFGGAAGVGTGAVLVGLGAVRAASIVGFEEGGKTKRGQAGFIEGFFPEIIAPEEDFYKIARAEIIPRLILEQDRQLNVRFAQRMAEKIQINGGASGGFDSRLMDRFESAITRLEKLEWTISGRDLKTVSRKQDEFDMRKGLT
jgi:hypothetical protein